MKSNGITDLIGFEAISEARRPAQWHAVAFVHRMVATDCLCRIGLRHRANLRSQGELREHQHADNRSSQPFKRVPGQKLAHLQI